MTKEDEIEKGIIILLILLVGFLIVGFIMGIIGMTVESIVIAAAVVICIVIIIMFTTCTRALLKEIENIKLE